VKRWIRKIVVCANKIRIIARFRLNFLIGETYCSCCWLSSTSIATTSIRRIRHDAVGTGVFARKVSAATLSYRFSADSRPTCIHPSSLCPPPICQNIIIVRMGEDRFKVLDLSYYFNLFVWNSISDLCFELIAKKLSRQKLFHKFPEWRTNEGMLTMKRRCLDGVRYSNKFLIFENEDE